MQCAAQPFDGNSRVVIAYYGTDVQSAEFPSPLVGEGCEDKSINRHAAGEGESPRGLCYDVGS
jgi:hypothetical protein